MFISKKGPDPRGTWPMKYILVETHLKQKGVNKMGPVILTLLKNRFARTILGPFDKLHNPTTVKLH